MPVWREGLRRTSRPGTSRRASDHLPRIEHDRRRHGAIHATPRAPVAAARSTSDAVAVRERSPALDAYPVVLAALITTWSPDLVQPWPIWLREWRRLLKNP